MVPCPEIMMTSGGSSSPRIFSSTSSPSIPVSHTSSRIRSKLLLRSNSRQSSPLGLTLVLYPSSSRTPRKDSRIPDSSSTMRMCAIVYLNNTRQWRAGRPRPATIATDGRAVRRSSLHRITRHAAAGLACRRSADCFDGHGQFDNEAAAERLVFFHSDRTMMVFHNSAHNSQTQPGATLLGGKVRQEQPFLNVARNSLPGVGDNQFDGIAAGHQRS